jgi:hypothetical protein
MAKVFVSSTYEDLVDYRDAVYRILREMRHDAISMEDYTASAARPLAKCLADVAECDIYVGVFAWRYGFTPPDSERAITELEFREAVRLLKPCLVFLLADDAPWSPKFIDADRSAIEGLRKELQRTHTVAFFRRPDELAAAVGAAVTNTCSATSVGTTLPQDRRDPAARAFYRTCLGRLTNELGSQIRFYSLASAALAAAGALVLTAGVVALEGSKCLIVSLGGVSICTATVFPVATLMGERRKKALLDSYEDELTKDSPALEALAAVKAFLDRQVSRPGVL